MAVKIILMAAAAAIILVIYALIENGKFRITRYDHITDKVKKPLTLAVLADMHNYSYGRENSRLLEAIRREKPDVVVSAGDMVTGSVISKGTKESVEFMTALAKEFPFVYGCGNHERKLLWDKDNKFPGTSDVYRRALEAAKKETDALMPLDNETRDFPDYNVKFFGLNLPGRYFRRRQPGVLTVKTIEEMVGKPEKDRLNILIGHDPDHFEKYAKWGADLVLSGHIHGGMIALPAGRGLISPKLTLMPKYDRGVFKLGKSTMILSGGLGNHTVHLRIFNRAELLIIRISNGNIG